MLTDAELAAMRDAQEAVLPDEAAVYRRVRTTDSHGGQIETWPEVTHTYGCRLSYRGIPSAYISMAAARNQVPLMVTFSQGADVLAGDRLSINGGAAVSVIGIASGGEWETAVRAVCVAVS